MLLHYVVVAVDVSALAHLGYQPLGAAVAGSKLNPLFPAGTVLSCGQSNQLERERWFFWWPMGCVWLGACIVTTTVSMRLPLFEDCWLVCKELWLFVFV